MTKAASYLLWRDQFSTIRNFLLEHMEFMVSDSTGIPPVFATKAGFEQTAFGHFKESFLGSIPDAALYYSAFDVFVLSSHSEGTPITILEAMAARVPIVATRVGGVPAMLDSTDAVLVPPAQPLSLAAAIDDVIGRPHERAAITTRAAKKVAAEYNPEPWLDAHERVYRQLAARFRSSSAKFASGRRSLAAQLDRANSS